MTTYYIDPDSGRDSNNGTSTSTPLKTLGYALALTGASDEIIFQNSTPTAPCSDVYLPVAGGTDLNDIDVVNAETLTADTMQYFWQGMDITHGTERPELFPNSSFDAWTDANTPFRITAGGTPVKETTVIDTRVAGRFAASWSVTAAYNGVNHNVYLVGGRTYEIQIIGKLTSTVTQFLTRIRNLLSSNYLQWSDGSWGAGADYKLWGTPGASTFEDFSAFSSRTTFTPESSTSHSITIITDSQTGADTGYLQYVSIKDTEDHTWVDEGSDVWSLPGMVVVPGRVLVTTVADWESNGMLGFKGEETGFSTEATEGAMAAAERSFWFDTSTRELKIHLPAGTTITDFHIELVTANPCITFKSDAVINNLTFGGSYGVSVTTGVTAGITAYNCHVINNMNFSWHIAAGNDNQLYGCSAKRSRGTKIQVGAAPDGDGFSVLGAGVKMTCTGCVAEETSDEGFENSNSAEIVCNGCFATLTGWETRASSVYVSPGFKKSNAGNATFRNCTAIDCDKYGIRNDELTTGTFTVSGCIALDNAYNDINLGPTTATLTVAVDENLAVDIYEPAGAAGWTAGTNNQLLTSAQMKINADGTLQSDFTQAIGTGTKWWSGARPVSASGEPYPDFDIDKGGKQSTYSPHHPSNL